MKKIHLYILLVLGGFFALAPKNNDSTSEAAKPAKSAKPAKPAKSEEAAPVRIEKLKVKQMFLPDMDCGAHSLKDATFAVELLKADPGSEEAKTILKKMNSLDEYKKCFPYTPGSRTQWSTDKVNSVMEENDIQDVMVFDTELLNIEIAKTLEAIFNHRKLLTEISKPNYIKGFVVSTGGLHFIACAIEKKGGKVIRAVSMESSNLYSVITPFGKMFKKTWLSNNEAVQRVIDFANDQSIARALAIEKLYRNFARVARRMKYEFHKESFKGFESFPGLYSYKSGMNLTRVMSEEVITEFKNKFNGMLEFIFKNNNKVRFHDPKKPTKVFPVMGKDQFLNHFKSESPFWKNLQFSPEEREEMIKVMGIN